MPIKFQKVQTNVQKLILKVYSLLEEMKLSLIFEIEAKAWWYIFYASDWCHRLSKV